MLKQTLSLLLAKGDTVEVAVLAHANGVVQFNFFPINNGK